MEKVIESVIKAAIDINDVFWCDIDTEPEEEGFYIVARFDGYGKLIEFSDNYVYVKEMGSNRVMYNGGSGVYVKGATHYISKRKFMQLLSFLPKKNKEGELIL